VIPYRKALHATPTTIFIYKMMKKHNIVIPSTFGQSFFLLIFWPTGATPLSTSIADRNVRVPRAPYEAIEHQMGKPQVPPPWFAALRIRWYGFHLNFAPCDRKLNLTVLTTFLAGAL
jgi:hypothetical protein